MKEARGTGQHTSVKIAPITYQYSLSNWGLYSKNQNRKIG